MCLCAKSLTRKRGSAHKCVTGVAGHLCISARIQEVAAGALIDVPGRQQAQGALSRARRQEMIQVVQLVSEIGVAQHDTLYGRTHSFYRPYAHTLDGSA